MCVYGFDEERERRGGRGHRRQENAKGGKRHANSREERREEADTSRAYCTVEWMNQSV